MPAVSAEDTEARMLALGLRRLILRGEHFRHMVARQVQLGASDLTAIGHLYTNGPITPRQLATRMEISSGTVTALLDRLERTGLLTRANNPSDRRSLLISITPTGRHAISWVYEQFDLAMHNALAAMPDLSVGRVADVLRVLGEALDERAPLHDGEFVPLPG